MPTESATPRFTPPSCAATSNLVKNLLAHGANPNAQITKGTPFRRNSQDYNLPATLIGATPYWLAAKFVEPTSCAHFWPAARTRP